MKPFKIDPRIFIIPPYIECPKCGNDSFGILAVNKDSYIRKCKVCFYPGRNDFVPYYVLPKLKKKVIYVDQFVISNMMKALNPNTKSYQKNAVDNFWIKCFEKLDSLCKLQLIICPESTFHDRESLVSPFYPSLKKMYSLLAGGVFFQHYETIKIIQLVDHACRWIAGKETDNIPLKVESVVRGDINAWHDRIKLMLSININYNDKWINKIRKVRNETNNILCSESVKWKTEKNKDFYEWYEIESMEYGRSVLELHLEYLESLKKNSANCSIPQIPPPCTVMVQSIQTCFIKAGVPEVDVFQKTKEYLLSPSLKEVPFIKISSMLYASLARKIASGRKKPPNRGMANDIELISVLLPYCDAMFIDNECHSYLKERPLCDVIDYGTKIFSPNNKNDFLEYLNDIEKNTPEGHFIKVREVYGTDWQKPYTTLYKEKGDLFDLK